MSFQSITRGIGVAAVAALGAILFSGNAGAQSRPTIDLPQVAPPDIDIDVDIGPIGPRRYRNGPFAAVPPEAPIFDDAISPREAMAIVRSTGFSPLGPPIRRGRFYTVAAFDRYGDDGRVLLDARTGRIVRFVPADDRNDDTVVTYAPPRAALPPANPRPALRPPVTVPRVANRSPAGAQPQNPANAAQTVRPAAPSQQSAATSRPVAAPPAAPQKPSVVLQPTQQLPAVQPLE